MSKTDAGILTVNGEERPVIMGRGATLLDMLRGPLHLTGTKQGCNYGVCGACTVLIDGKAARSCLALADNCSGRSIVTVEGLADDPIARVLREAMVTSGAVQCGFCTPGMTVALWEFLQVKRDRPPTAHAIREWLGGNICRCTGYVKIVEAVAAALERLSSESGHQSEAAS